MTEWYRRKLRHTGYKGACASVVCPLGQHLTERQSWTDSLQTSCDLLLFTVLAMGFVAWQGRRAANRDLNGPGPDFD